MPPQVLNFHRVSRQNHPLPAPLIAATITDTMVSDLPNMIKPI
jgi:hypothetical protein